MKPQIDMHAKLSVKFKEYQETCMKTVGYVDFINEYKEMQKMDIKNSQSDEWKHLEISFKEMLNQINTKSNDEIQVIQESLKEQLEQLMNHKEEQWSLKFNDLAELNSKFQNQIGKSLGQFITSDLCPLSFQIKLQQKLNYRIRGLQLLYKLGVDPKDVATVWKRINGKANTLMLIVLENNQVIGAYTPAIWNSQQVAYVSDQTASSFLFSITRQEIYPLYKTYQQAIYCNANQLPSFGTSATELCIQNNFTAQSSTLGANYQITQYEVVDNTTHLLNAKSVGIKQFEIYQLALE